MTLDEAIEHAREVATGCGPCAEDHRHLAEFLEELRDRRAGKPWVFCTGCSAGAPEGEAHARGFRWGTFSEAGAVWLCRDCRDDVTGRETGP